MANSNFVVQNGLTVGTTTIFAGNGDIATTGNISVTGGGSFGGLSTNQIYQSASNVTVSGSYVNVAIGSSNIASFSSTGLQVTNLTVTGTETILNTEYLTTVNATNLYAVTIGNVGAAHIGSTGRFDTSVTTGTLNAATIGNASAVLYGTLNSSSASQPNITTLAGVTSIGASGSTTLTGTLQTAAQTNITSVGTLSGLTSGTILPSGNLTVNLGSTTAWWNVLYGKATQAQYADLAENYQGDRQYTPGTVLMFGGSAEVTLADADTTAVAGVVSTNPAHLMNGGLTGANVVPLALQGRVPCQVIGPVAKGDLMVSAGFGFAKTNNLAAVGQVIGKALQDVTFAGKAVIEVVVGRF